MRAVQWVPFLLLLFRISVQAQFSGDGTGVADDPYMVETVAHLNEVRNHLHAHFRQIADIDMDVEPYHGGTGWTPIGTTSSPFSGVYDGNGHTVSNLFIHRGSTDYQGLFGFLDGGRIEGLTVLNFDVTARDRSGGLVGQIENGSVVSNCAAIGTLTVRSRVGALVGSVQDHSRIEDSYAHASVTASSERAGVLTGQLWNHSAAIRSFALGSVSGTIRTGGLVGNQNNSTVEDCYSGAQVLGTSSVGGLAGALSGGAVTRSYSYGAVEGSGSNLGGLIGDVSASPEVTASYWDMETSLQATSGGEPGAAGKLTPDMVQQDTYGGWDFDTLWAIGHEGAYTYPYFQGQASSTLPAADVRAPFAGDLVISGTALPGEILTGQYTFYPGSDGHPEDTAWFQWSRADGPAGPFAEIAGATNIAFEIEGGGEHRWYRFDVTVRDTGGVTSHTHTVTLNFLEGAGTLADPFQIEHEYQLNGVRDHLGGNFLQVAALDLAPYANWVPIGTEAEPFTGTYHGGGNTILNLTIDRPDEDHVGLFGYVDSPGWIRYLTLKDVSVLGGNTVGALTGFNESTAETIECHVTGSVTGTGNRIGGLFGVLRGTLSDSSAVANVEGMDFVGGLVGGNPPGSYSSCTVQRCTMRGHVKGRNSVAGLAALRGRGNNNMNHATVEGNQTVGGVFGSVSDSAISYCVNYGHVSAVSNFVGGVVGSISYSGLGSSGGASYCYNLGSVAGATRVGGIAGSASGQPVSLSYNLGPVIGTSSVGGIAGHSHRTIWGAAGIHSCYNAGEVGGTSDAGALVGSRSAASGYSPPSVTRSYHDHQTSGASDLLGFERSTAEMVQQVTFADWDFDTIWSIGHDGQYTYPYLQWQATKDVPYVDLTIPYASDVFVTGTDSVGETLTGHYTYHPNSAGDPEGASTFRWLRGDNQAGPFEAVPDATNRTYTLVEGDHNRWYRFEVTVRDVEDNTGAPVSAILEFTQGSGSKDDPWLIGNAMQLDRIRNYLGSAHSDRHFALIADIDLGVPPWNEGAGWEPIGFSFNDSFRGQFNGRGHVIRNLAINRPANNYQGLFGYLSGGEVVLLGLENADVAGDRYVGTLAGYIASSSLVRYTYAQGAVEGTVDTGGLIGYNTGSSVEWSYSAATVTGGASNVGGLLGFGGAHACYWDVDVSGQATSGNGAGQVGLSTGAMQDPESYVGWNFYTCWQIDEEEYPAFQNMAGRQDIQPLTLDDLAGAGTAEEPYLVGNVHELNVMRLDLAAYYRLSNDIDMAATVLWDMARGWTPVGSGAARFTGSLEGAGHTISNLTAVRPGTTYQALFGYTENARIEHLALSRPYVIGGAYSATLAAFASGTIIRNLEIESARLEGANYTGGLVGYAQSGCGLEFLRVHGIIQGANDTGGLAGYVSGGTVHASLTDVMVTGGTYVGGLIGRTAGGLTLYHCRSAGEVTGGNQVGGLIGHFATATMSDCSSHAAVEGSSNVGGLIGYMGATSSSATRARVYRSFSVGPVNGTSAAGGLVGAVNHDGNNMVFDSYWDTETSEQAESVRGSGQNTATMQSEAGYPEFNFSVRWSIDEGDAYPELRDMSAYPQPQAVDLANLSGDGTEENPFIILTLDHLNAIRQDPAAHYRLGAHMDATATVAWDAGRGWTPVGSSGEAFGGSFDGDGYTISHLTVSRPNTDYQALFGYLSGAQVQRLGLAHVSIQGARYTGGLAGYVTGGAIAFVEVAGEIHGGNDTGGLLGYGTGGCTVQAVAVDVSLQGGDRTGGLVGSALGNTTLYHASARGVVRGANTVGGLVGNLQNARATDSYSLMTVYGDSTVGGAVGVNGGGTGNIGYMHRVYRAVPVTGTGSSIGGLLGSFSRGAVHESYWDLDASGQPESARGTGYPTAEMRQAATYRLHNFVTLWEIDEGNGYPVFRDLSGHAQPTKVDLDDLDGEGTEDLPYLITNADELNAMRQDLAAHYRLANGIDLSASVTWNAGRGWDPVGSSSAPFTGSLDGAGHTIHNLVVTRPNDNDQGLFGYLSGAHVSHVTLDQAHVYGDASVGALAGQAISGNELERIRVSGIIGGQGNEVGGLVGRIAGGSVQHAFVQATVDTKGSTVGGLVGWAGGSAHIQFSSSKGSVEGTSIVGGLLGRIWTATLTDSYSLMAAHGGSSVGGAAGINGAGVGTAGYVYRVYSAGSVTGTGDSIGGLLGSHSRGDVDKSYWDTEASGQSESARGEGRNTAEMTYPHDAETTYLGWDFVAVWSEDFAALNAGYPRLLNPNERNLIYKASTGGVISGPARQVVLAGQDGTPVKAMPDEGAEFDQWSDGRTDNPRIDANVTANLSVTALFKSVSLVPIDWYDAHEIAPEEGETWADVDQRYDPDKRMTLAQQFIADLNPNDSNAVFRILRVDAGPPMTVHFEPGSTGRVYVLQYSNDLAGGNWTNVPGAVPRFGQGGADALADTNTVPFRSHRVQVEVP